MEDLVVLMSKEIPIELIKIKELALDPDKTYIVDLNFKKDVSQEQRAKYAMSIRKVFRESGIEHIILNPCPDFVDICIKEFE